MNRWRYLSLERPRLGARFRWKDRILSSLGLALGVLFLIVSWGLIAPAQELVRSKILGSLPDRIRAAPSKMSLGPLAVGGDVSESTVEQAGEIPGVKAVYRQAHFPEPSQLRARYAGEGLLTDLVLEMCDEGQVAGEIASGYEFKDPGPGKDVPAVVPAAILDLVNSGISVNTKLPQLSSDALIGKHFTLYLGTSSYRPGPYREVRCVIVGVSDQIGAGGPAIPYETGLRLTQEKPKLHTLTLQLDDPKVSGQVVGAMQTLGLRAPRLEIAERVDGIASLLKVLGLLLPGAILLVTALGLTSTLELQVTRERQLIALYRALGATPGQTAGLYLVRALSVALTGFAAGVIGGLVTGRMLALFLESKLSADLLGGVSLFQPPLSSVAIALVFCLGVCLLAGWIPARQAARVEPAQAFREPG